MKVQVSMKHHEGHTVSLTITNDEIHIVVMDNNRIIWDRCTLHSQMAQELSLALQGDK